MKPAERYPAILLLVFGTVWIALAIAPSYRQDWLLENVLIFVAVPLLVATSRTLRFSNAAYTCIFVFLVLHAIGAHYTYSEVPWREWLPLTDAGTGPDAARRNNYDRFVHFSYGLLMFPAVWELFAARASPQRLWRYVMPVTFLMAHSVIYELIEWGAAEVFGGDLGVAYLGTQGDEWDAQKDMGLATAGILAGLLLTLAFSSSSGSPPAPASAVPSVHDRPRDPRGPACP
jgi:putative membrane protein